MERECDTCKHYNKKDCNLAYEEWARCMYLNSLTYWEAIDFEEIRVENRSW